ncbi:acetyltransferase [Streptococcus sp. X16XC17]|uniref:acetyltransferase n=1 Tax=unclassified Streptococcus TaxID=2608887 RepID=UPI00066FC6CB|nr:MULTISPECIES: acetyltransferase [unclassified Streptococcus]TCD46271.1 acetyltransferase [Streptococcus sp. X16XC17]
MKKKLAFLGAGSHADAIIPVVDQLTYEFIGFFDDKNISEHDGYPVLGKMYDVLKFLDSGTIDAVFITIGDNAKRRELFDYVAKDYYESIINIISPNALVLTPESICGRGIFIGFGAFVGSKVQLFDNNVLNTGALIEHHTIVGPHCNIAPNATINGLCKIEEQVYVGSASVIIQTLKIASKTTIGAGTVVVKDIVESGTYVGVPSKKIK